MNIPAFAIQHKLFTIMTFVTLLFLGIASYLSMPQTEDPVLHLPVVAVTVVYPGASPVDIEKHVVDLLEVSLNRLPKVKAINTKIKESVSFTAVEFDYGVDPNEKEKEVQASVNALLSQLPEGIFEIEVEKYSTTSVTVLQVGLVSETASFAELMTTGKSIEKQLEKVSGVSKISVEAFPDQEVRIALNPTLMTQMNISIENIERAIKSTNANIPGGVVKVSNRMFNVRTSGVYKNLDQIKNTIVGAFDGKLVYLKNVAEVFLDYEDEKWMARHNGKRCVFINLQQKEGTNIFSVLEPAKVILEKVALPKNMKLEVIFDQSKDVKSRTSDFIKNLLQGIVFVGLIIFMLLGFRSATLVMISIPFSILIGLWMADLSGFGLQQTTITALVVALGLLVDNSITIIENIERFLREGLSPKEAAIKGTQQLIAPMASATFTTILAFIPILSIQNVTGAFIRSLPVTVIGTLVASFIIATTLTPFLASKLMKKSSPDSKPNQTFAFRHLQNFVNGSFDKMLKWTSHHQKITVAFSLLCLVGSFALFPKVGVSLFPKAEKPLFRIQIQLPEDSNLDATNRVTKYVESVLAKEEEVDFYVSNVGRGNPRVYYNMNTADYSNRFAELIVFTKSYEPKAFAAFLKKLRATFKNFAEGQINIIEFSQGPSVNPPILINIYGEELADLQKYANEVTQKAAQIPGIINIRNPLSKNKTELFFNINREKALLLGVPIHTIDQTIRTFVHGNSVGKFQDEKGESLNMVLRFDYENHFQIEDFDQISVKSLNGFFVPLKQLADIEFKQTPGSIDHTDLSRTVKIYADLGNGFLVNEVLEKLRPELDQMNWKEGYSYKYEGEVEEQSESLGGLSTASLLALFLILSVLIIHFQSFSQLLIIFSALPLAFIGAIVALFLTGNSFSFTALVGLTSLIGIAINNSLVLVDYANQLCKEGKSILEAAHLSAKVRFIPILMTTMTTILGLLPLTLAGGTMWAPMGWVIIGGLISSTTFVLIVVPIFYQWLTKPIP